MWEPLVNVLVNDIRLVQNQVALDQNGYLTIRVHNRDIFRFVVKVNVPNLEIHAFFKQHEAATMRKGVTIEAAAKAGLSLLEIEADTVLLADDLEAIKAACVAANMTLIGINRSTAK